MEKAELNSLRTTFADIASTLTAFQLEQKQELKVSFPRGVIRKLDDITPRWPFEELSTETKRNLACFIQLCDVNRWILNTWDIGLTAGYLWEWQCCLPVIAILETLLHSFGYAYGFFNEDTQFKKVINTLQSKSVYDGKHKEQLHELRNYRNRIHVFLVKEKIPLHDGKRRHYNNCVRILTDTEALLINYRSTHPLS